jgi:hypothetical protein
MKPDRVAAHRVASRVVVRCIRPGRLRRPAAACLVAEVAGWWLPLSVAHEPQSTTSGEGVALLATGQGSGTVPVRPQTLVSLARADASTSLASARGGRSRTRRALGGAGTTFGTRGRSDSSRGARRGGARGMLPAKTRSRSRRSSCGYVASSWSWSHVARPLPHVSTAVPKWSSSSPRRAAKPTTFPSASVATYAATEGSTSSASQRDRHPAAGTGGSPAERRARGRRPRPAPERGSGRTGPRAPWRETTSRWSLQCSIPRRVVTGRPRLADACAATVAQRLTRRP